MHGTILIDFLFSFHFHFGMDTDLVDLLVEYCDHILRFNALVSAYASYLISYQKKRQRENPP